MKKEPRKGKGPADKNEQESVARLDQMGEGGSVFGVAKSRVDENGNGNGNGTISMKTKLSGE